MKNIIRFLIPAMLIISSPVYTQYITQDEFLSVLKQNHPISEKELLTSKIEQEEQNSLLGSQDWNIISSVDYSHEKPMIAFSGPERIDALSAKIGIERSFWNTGGRLSSSYSSGWANIKINPAFGFPSSFFQNRFDITYTHPLLKNKKGFLERLQFDLKKYDIDFAEIQALENIENFLAESAQKYLDWVYLDEQKKIIAERLKLSEEELVRIQRKREANLVDQADVLRAEDAVRIWKQNQVLVESLWKALQAELAVLSGNDDIYDSNPHHNLYNMDQLFPLDESISKIKTDSRLIGIINVRLSQLEFANRGFDEISKPDLSLITQFNIKRLDNSLGESLIMDKPDFLVGLQYSFPYENRKAKHKIIKTNMQISQLHKQKDELILALSSVLTNLHIQITELKNILELNQDQIKSAARRTEEELKLYNQGRGELTFVIQSRDNEQNAKLTYTGNALTYHKLMIEYKALMDQIN